MGRTIRHRWSSLLLVMLAVLLSGWHYDCGLALPTHCEPALCHSGCDLDQHPPVHHGTCDRTPAPVAKRLAWVAPVPAALPVPLVVAPPPSTAGPVLPVSVVLTPPSRFASPVPARAPPSHV